MLSILPALYQPAVMALTLNIPQAGDLITAVSLLYVHNETAVTYASPRTKAS